METPAFIKNILPKIQNIPTRTRLYVFIGLVAVLIILFVWQFHIPMNNEILALENEISGLQATIKKNDDKIRKLDELRVEVKTLEARLKVLTEQLPPESEVSGLLRQIQDLVTQSGLSLKLWRPGARKRHPSSLYEEIPITIDLSGGYHDAALFFDRVSKLTRIVNTRNLKMSGASMNKSGFMDIKMNCTAITFAAVEKTADAEPKKKKNR